MSLSKVFSSIGIFILAVNLGISGGGISLTSYESTMFAAISSSVLTKQDPTCYSFTKEIPFGDKSKEVSILQKALKKSGLIIKGPEIGTKPYFGTATRSALSRFQEKSELEVTGKFDLETRTALNAFYSCPLVIVKVPDAQISEVLALPSEKLVQGRNVLFREKITALATSTSLGILSFDHRTSGVSFSEYQIFLYNSSSFSGPTRISSPFRVGTSTIEFDLSSISLSRGQSVSLQLVGNALVTGNNAYSVSSRKGKNASPLVGGRNPRKAFQVTGFEIPTSIRGGDDFSIRATVQNTSGTSTKKYFDAELVVTNPAKAVVYRSLQHNAGYSSLTSGSTTRMYFGTVSGGLSSENMSFAPGKYVATLELRDRDIPTLIIDSFSEGFEIKAPLFSKSEIVTVLVPTEDLKNLFTALLRNISDYRVREKGLGPVTSSCFGGIFGDPLLALSMSKIRPAGGMTLVCRSTSQSVAISALPISPEPSLCADSFGYVGPGKVEVIPEQGIAYCLRGIGNNKGY